MIPRSGHISEETQKNQASIKNQNKYKAQKDGNRSTRKETGTHHCWIQVVASLSQISISQPKSIERGNILQI